MPQISSPIVQQPQTPLFYPGQQPSNLQQQPSFGASSHFPATQSQQQQPQQSQAQFSQQQPLAADVAASAASRRQVARGLSYKDSAYESRRHSQTNSALTVDSFRLLSVLGRGHFGKVILSQYKNTGKFLAFSLFTEIFILKLPLN